MKCRYVVLLLVLALAVMASPAFGQDVCQAVPGNFIVNCGFETGNFAGWREHPPYHQNDQLSQQQPALHDLAAAG